MNQRQLSIPYVFIPVGSTAEFSNGLSLFAQQNQLYARHFTYYNGLVYPGNIIAIQWVRDVEIPREAVQIKIVSTPTGGRGKSLNSAQGRSSR